jgi:hypothetical protein
MLAVADGQLRQSFAPIVIGCRITRPAETAVGTLDM